MEQARRESAKAGKPGSWASRIELGSSLEQLYDLVKNVPVPLRGGLDSDLAAFAEELIALKARSGEAAAAFALSEIARSRTYLDCLVPDSPPDAAESSRAPSSPPDHPKDERNPPCP